jgi:hypothetical protein
MPDRGSTIEFCDPFDLTGVAERVLAFRERYRMMPGKRGFVMLEPEVSPGGVVLPVSGRMRPDLGVCSESGEVCILAPYRGLWVEDASFGSARMVGVNETVSEAVLGSFVSGALSLSPGWLLVRREDVSSSFESGSRYGVCGIVEACGPRVGSCLVGERVVLSGSEVVYDLGSFADRLWDDPGALVFVYSA